MENRNLKDLPTIDFAVGDGRRGKITFIIYALTAFLSAFLLFQIQPMFSKYILPWFGGSTMVWTTAMLFFQVFLVVGYTYAHLLIKFFKPLKQITIHIVLLVVASIFAFYVMPAAEWKPLGDENPVWQILLILTVHVGLPYFVLSTTGPLIQAWFSKANSSFKTYKLYGVSNVGSLIGLLSYPFFVEPVLTLKSQANFWTVVFLLFAVGAGYCAWLSYKSKSVEEESEVVFDFPTEKPSMSKKLIWLGLTASASIMVLAVTNHLTQDVASIPFLWVVPFSLYIASFIIVFSKENLYIRELFFILFLVSIGLFVFIMYSHSVIDLIFWIFSYNFGLFVFCMVFHGELVKLKPDPKYLTSFYLYVSIGGAIGGLFVSIIAPIIFASLYELHFGILFGMFMLLFVLIRDGSAHDFFRDISWSNLRYAAVTVAAVLLLIFNINSDFSKNTVEKTRNFYGVLEVKAYDKDNPDIERYTLKHGTTLHGTQYTSENKRKIPTTYYAHESGLGHVMRYLRHKGDLRIGAIGLGVGTVAAYGQEGDYIRFYEINPKVPEIAGQYFTYLSDSPAEIEIAMGDARLSLEKEDSQDYDIVIVDAFSSDAIPVHLITREAIEVYLKHLKKDGVIAVHISNRHLNLDPVDLKLADYFNLEAILINADKQGSVGMTGSTWMFLTYDKELAKDSNIEPIINEDRKEYDHLKIWTDDYSNLFKILK